MGTNRPILITIIVVILAAFTSAQIQSQSLEPKTEVALVLDDGSHFAVYGVSYTDNTAKQFIWLNRFSPESSSFPFTLNEIWVLFDEGDGSNNIQVGDAIDLIVYQDEDGDPANGADLLVTISNTVQFVDGNNWSKYPLFPGIFISGPGDVLIGVVNRYTEDGVSDRTYPAACDMTIDHGRSWWGWWAQEAPDPAILPPDDTFKLKVGNWMIRGYGETTSIPPSEAITMTPTSTPTSSATPRVEDGHVFMPFTMKSRPPTPTPTSTPEPTPKLAIVNVDNDTGGQLCYEVLNTGIGEKCFQAGEHYYGSFTAGTYSWKVSARCGSASGSKYFSPGEWTHRFWCAAGNQINGEVLSLRR